MTIARNKVSRKVDTHQFPKRKENNKAALEVQAGHVSVSVMDKNHLKMQVTRILKSIRWLVYANCPDNSTGVLRSIGYLDEQA